MILTLLKKIKIKPIFIKIFTLFNKDKDLPYFFNFTENRYKKHRVLALTQNSGPIRFSVSYVYCMPAYAKPFVRQMFVHISIVSELDICIYVMSLFVESLKHPI